MVTCILNYYYYCHYHCHCCLLALLLLERYAFRHLFSYQGKPLQPDSYSQNLGVYLLLVLSIFILFFSLSFLEAKNILKQFSYNENIIFLTLSAWFDMFWPYHSNHDLNSEFQEALLKMSICAPEW